MTVHHGTYILLRQRQRNFPEPSLQLSADDRFLHAKLLIEQHEIRAVTRNDLPLFQTEGAAAKTIVISS